MRRVLVLLGLATASIFYSAHAQIGNIFGDSKPISARTAWAQLPNPRLACVDRLLQSQGSAVTALIQENVYPNNPQLHDIIQKCEQAERPQIEDASRTVKDAIWSSRSPEERLGFFLETFWVDRLLDHSRCVPAMSNSYSDQKDCLARSGFTLSVASTHNCEISITEHTPAPENPKRTWDGKIVDSAIVARDLTIQLSGLDENLIRDNSGSYDLYFEIFDPTTVSRRIAYSSAPTSWVLVSPPPLASAFDGTAEQKYEALTHARVAWAQDVGQIGAVDIPGFEIATFFNQQDTNSQDGLERIQANRSRTFLKVSTAYFGHAYRSDQAVSIMTNAFIATVKDILSSCKR